MTKHEEILEFINRRWKADADWCTGNCWYFASILIERFPHLSRYYFPVQGHFVAGDGERYYDWSGECNTEYAIYKWEDLYKTDKLWAERLMRDCKN